MPCPYGMWVAVIRPEGMTRRSPIDVKQAELIVQVDQSQEVVSW
jgi:hypothetical protein